MSLLLILKIALLIVVILFRNRQISIGGGEGVVKDFPWRRQPYILPIFPNKTQNIKINLLSVVGAALIPTDYQIDENYLIDVIGIGKLCNVRFFL